MLEKRLEILFEPSEYELLKSIAVQEHRSVGEIIREAVREKYLVGSDAEKEAAMQRVLSGKYALDWPEWDELEKAIAREVARPYESD